MHCLVISVYNGKYLLNKIKKAAEEEDKWSEEMHHVESL